MAVKKGSVIGGAYLVEHTIARNARAEVVAATRIEDRSRVALKLFPATSPEFLSRFARARAIRSDHVPTLYDVGTEGDRTFVVMELVVGEAFDAVLKRGPLPIPTALEYALQACDGVAAAHAAGVVHRRLKTSRLVLTFYAAAPVVKVLGVGTSPPGDDASAPDADDADFLAPEQRAKARGDERSDIWALGVIMYDLFTGRRPTTQGAQPQPLRALRPEVPWQLEQAVLRCLENDVATRIASVSALSEQLAKVADVLAPKAAARARSIRPPPASPSKAPPAFANSERQQPAAQTAKSAVITPSSSELVATAAPFVAMFEESKEGTNAGTGTGTPAFRRITSDGRIEAMDAESAARATRAKRVAKEAEALSRDARANPPRQPVKEHRADEDEDDQPMPIAVRDPAAPVPSVARPTATESTDDVSSAPDAGWRKVVILLVVALICGLAAGGVAVLVQRSGKAKNTPRPGSSTISPSEKSNVSPSEKKPLDRSAPP